MLLERIFLHYKIHKVNGKDNIPKENFIVLFNNSHYLFNLSYLEKFTNKIHIVLDSNLFHKFKKYSNKKEHIPYSREIRRKAFDLARLYLKNNHNIAIHKKFESFELAKLTLRSKCPILPITLRKNSITIKDPFYPVFPKKITIKKIKELEKKILKL